jgi:hypothetical protein
LRRLVGRPALERLEDRTVPSTLRGTLFHDLDADNARGAGEPGLAEDLNAQHRYNAARAAALAGCGAGEDAAHLTDSDRAGLRKQALDWLRADLEAWRKILDQGPPPGPRGRADDKRPDRWPAGRRHLFAAALRAVADALEEAAG